MLIDEIQKEYKNRTSYSEIEKEIQNAYETIILNIKTYARVGIDSFTWRTGWIEDIIVEGVRKKLANDHFILTQYEFGDGIVISGWAIK